MTNYLSRFFPAASGPELPCRIPHSFNGVKRMFCAWMLLISIPAVCATKENSTDPPKPQNGIQEYQQITVDAIAAMNKALKSLNRVATHTNACPASLVDAFADSVQRLHVESVPIRSRAQAIQARGDAYFANWCENLARIKDPQVRELAERFHPQLQQCFSKTKAASQETCAAFRNFCSGVRKIRNSLQNNPAVLESQSMQDLIRTTRTHGQEVLQHLGSLQAELKEMKSMITPTKANTNH